jgi:hypothetical protein
MTADFFFDLTPFWQSEYLYKITINGSTWEASIFDKREMWNKLYQINYNETPGKKIYLVKTIIEGKEFTTILELIYDTNNDLVQYSLYDEPTECLIYQVKYEYISYDNYGNWLECDEEMYVGKKTRITREILYY